MLNDYDIVGVVPNPFNPTTSIRFTLPRALAVTAEVWSVDGRRVVTLLRGDTLPAGENEVRWDGRNTGGAARRIGGVSVPSLERSRRAQHALGSTRVERYDDPSGSTFEMSTGDNRSLTS